MRPVTKGNPPNYLYYTVAAEQNNYETFNANSALAIVNNPPPGSIAGPSVTWSVEQVMNELLDKTVTLTPWPNPSTPKNRSRAVKAMRERLEVIYRGAKADLTGMLGDFCSFCEMPVAGTLLAVEHRAPKSLYPTYSVWWGNFLLVCRDCNSCKGNIPARATATGWAIAAGHNPPNENDLVNAIRDHYYWPDLYNNTYRVINRTYYYNTQTVPIQMTDVEAANLANRIVSYTMNVVRGDVFAGGAMRNNRYVECQIFNNGGGTDGTDTITMLGLEIQDNPRSALRTRAWFLMCANVANLLNTCALITGAGSANNKRYAFNGIWTGLLYLAVQTGYYSVWVNITDGWGFPPGMNVGALPVALQADLGAQFVFDTNTANNATIGQTFRGTNVTAVP